MVLLVDSILLGHELEPHIPEAAAVTSVETMHYYHNLLLQQNENIYNKLGWANIQSFESESNITHELFGTFEYRN